jgi:hypothetical protein
MSRAVGLGYWRPAATSNEVISIRSWVPSPGFPGGLRLIWQKFVRFFIMRFVSYDLFMGLG